MDSSRCRARLREASPSYTALTLAPDHAYCFLVATPSLTGCAHYVSRCGSRRLGIVSIYPYRAHTAKEPVGDGPRGRCYGLVEKLILSDKWVGKGLKGRSALQTASKRVQELSIRYMRPLGTSLGHIHSYCTCISMSILNQPIGRCEQIMRCSGWPRSTPSRSHNEHSIDSCRGRRVANGNSLQHAVADSLCVARMRSAASWAAHRHEQPYTGASEVQKIELLTRRSTTC